MSVAGESLIFIHDPWERLNELIHLKNYSTVFVLSDENTNKHCLDVLKSNLESEVFFKPVIPAGEKNKSIESCEIIWKEWLENNIDRNSLVICLGGGMICDLGGFCAASMMRGLDCIYIPTSLMAMADAAIGGKTAINLGSLKNTVGLFRMPLAVLIEMKFLQTLDSRQLKSGIVEMIKHGIIQSPCYWSDFNLSKWPPEEDQLLSWVKRSIRTKTDIVNEDFKESGLRKILNFGHTIGHAIESCSFDENEAWLHGEAVAAGMIYESILSSDLFDWKPGWLDQFIQILLPFCREMKFDEQKKNKICELLRYDKKRTHQKVGYTLLESPGKPVIDQFVAEEKIRIALNYFD